MRIEISEEKYKLSSIICLLISILIWIPNIIMKIASPLWILTFIISPIGIALAVRINHYFLIIANSIMLLSFFIFMAIGYFINAYF